MAVFNSRLVHCEAVCPLSETILTVYFSPWVVALGREIYVRVSACVGARTLEGARGMEGTLSQVFSA